MSGENSVRLYTAIEYRDVYVLHEMEKQTVLYIRSSIRRSFLKIIWINNENLLSHKDSPC